MTLEERLNDLIEVAESKIIDLENELQSYKDKENIQNREWQLPKYSIPTELTKNLPVPRIEMRYIQEEYISKWTYGIVHRPFWLRFEDNKDAIVFMGISQTTGSGTSRVGELPFRDGLHVKEDMKTFNLPGFFVCEQENFVKNIDEI